METDTEHTLVCGQAYVAICETITEQVEIPASEVLSEPGKESEEPPGDGEDSPEAPSPQLRTVEVDILRYIASSHPGV